MLIKNGKPTSLGENSKGREMFLLMEDFIYNTYAGAFVVPRGFVTDLASIPSWLFFWDKGLHDQSAIVHDFLYHYGKIRVMKNNTIYIVSLNKKQADKLFALMIIEMSKTLVDEGKRSKPRHLLQIVEAKLMHIAVSLFGGIDGSYGKLQIPEGST